MSKKKGATKRAEREPDDDDPEEFVQNDNE